jgi:signal peptidase I
MGVRGTENQKRWLRSVPRLLGGGLLVAVLATGIWMIFPVHLGGSTALVIVQGKSMLPTIAPDDLAVTRTSDRYEVGDVVAYRVEDDGTRGMVIHRIVSGSAEAGWRTQGDNNDWVDEWVVPNDYVLGEHVMTVPGGGKSATWVLRHPYAAAAGMALITMAMFLPLRRGRLTPELRDALAEGERVPAQSGREPTDFAVLAITGVGAAASGSVVILAFLQREWSASATAALAGFVVCAGYVVFLFARLYDGRGVAEPLKSYWTLSERLWIVAELPEVESPEVVSSARALRDVAERHRSPVLVHIDAKSRRHRFLVMTARRGNFMWDSFRGSKRHVQQKTRVVPTRDS